MPAMTTGVMFRRDRIVEGSSQESIGRQTPPKDHYYLVPLLLILLFIVIVLRTAWVSDDAYISFRTIDNFVHGYGLTWNPGERVQAFTHPLWLLVLTGGYLATNNLYLLSIGMSLLFASAAVVILVMRIGRSIAAIVLALTILILSKAFVDYSTSGLENPLTYALLAAFFAYYLRSSFIQEPRSLFPLALMAALGLLNRLDTALLYVPALLYAWYKTGGYRTGAKYIGFGFMPLLIWELFSVVYYGFPLPNTFYAKFNHGIPQSELAIQGFVYLLDSLNRDPITLFSILGISLSTFVYRHRKLLPLTLGIWLYILYVITIGGDFMSGRFLAAPLFCAATMLAYYRLSDRVALSTGSAFVLIVLLGFSGPTPTVFSTGTYGAGSDSVDERTGIADERGYYYSDTGLLRATRTFEVPHYRWRYQGEIAQTRQLRSITRGGVGFFGYYAGPTVHIIDQYALADPLLARLPAERQVAWRIGHYERELPAGYAETIRASENRLVNESLARYYDKLHNITAGPLWSRQRFIDILAMNLGMYDHLVDFDTYYYWDKTTATASPDGHLVSDDGTVLRTVSFKDPGIDVALDAVSRAPRIAIWIEAGGEYEVTFLNDGQSVGKRRLPDLAIERESIRGITIHDVLVPEEAQTAGYDQVEILPLAGESPYALSRVYPYEGPRLPPEHNPVNQLVSHILAESDVSAHRIDVLYLFEDAMFNRYTLASAAQQLAPAPRSIKFEDEDEDLQKLFRTDYVLYKSEPSAPSAVTQKGTLLQKIEADRAGMFTQAFEQVWQYTTPAGENVILLRRRFTVPPGSEAEQYRTLVSFLAPLTTADDLIVVDPAWQINMLGRFGFVKTPVAAATSAERVEQIANYARAGQRLFAIFTSTTTSTEQALSERFVRGDDWWFGDTHVVSYVVPSATPAQRFRVDEKLGSTTLQQLTVDNSETGPKMSLVVGLHWRTTSGETTAHRTVLRLSALNGTLIAVRDIPPHPSAAVWGGSVDVTQRTALLVPDTFIGPRPLCLDVARYDPETGEYLRAADGSNHLSVCGVE